MPLKPISYSYLISFSLISSPSHQQFNTDLVDAAPRFREWFNHITPEVTLYSSVLSYPLLYCNRVVHCSNALY